MARAFFSVAAAEGNLGDVHIRRELVRLVASMEIPATVFTGTMSRAYVRALNIPDNWHVTDSGVGFMLSLARSAVMGRARVFLAPGPAVFRPKFSEAAKHLGVLAMFMGVRLARGQVFVVGRSVRASVNFRLGIERAIAYVANYYSVRDDTSVQLLNAGAKVQRIPDLAFGQVDHVREADRRARVGISLRYDRKVDLDAFAKLIEMIRGLELTPVLITQVREDNQRHEELADLCQIERVLWEAHDDHIAQEMRVTDAYRHCLAVVSDRLHVLLLCAREGAIPVMVETIGEAKIRPTLDLYLPLQAVSLEVAGRSLTLDLTALESARIEGSMCRASKELDRELAEIRAALRRPARTVDEGRVR